MSCSCEALIKAIDAYINKADSNLEDALTDAGFVDAGEAVSEISTLESKVADALKAETAVILEAAAGAVSLEVFAADIWPGIKSMDDLGAQLQIIFLDEFQRYMPELVSHYMKKIDPELVVNAITQRTTFWIESWSEELAKLMKLNSHKEVDAILIAGLEKGQGVADFTQALLDSGVRDEYYRARGASITEVLTAHSVAQQESIMQSPAVEEKEWAHTGGHKNEPRPNHVAMNGKIVPKNEPFELIGADGVLYYPMYPRDIHLPAGERISCHCIHRGIVSADILGLPLKERQRLQAEAIAADDEEWEMELDAINRAKAGIE